MTEQLVIVGLFLGALLVPMLLIRLRRGASPTVVSMESSLLLPGGQRLYIVMIEGERVLLSGTKEKLELMWRLKGPLLGSSSAPQDTRAEEPSGAQDWIVPKGTALPTSALPLVQGVPVPSILPQPTWALSSFLWSRGEQV